MNARNVAIFIFDEVEVLDFCGPFEVFSVTGKRQGLNPFNVYTVAKNSGPVLARNALSINPHYNFADCPQPDILLIPGGAGTRKEMHKIEVSGMDSGPIARDGTTAVGLLRISYLRASRFA